MLCTQENFRALMRRLDEFADGRARGAAGAGRSDMEAHMT
jgi:hypothetical protein